jgi:hypothetical protein
MSDMDENDIIIVLADQFRSEKEKEFTIEYANLDSGLGIPQGSTAKHLEVAAKDAGFDVVRRGSTRANLRRASSIPPVSFSSTDYS